VLDVAVLQGIMPTISVIRHDGSQVTIPATLGISLMEVLRNAGVDEVQALCGGCCSCATCHVFVLEGAERLPPAGEEEHAMLEGSSHRSERSRLSCQLTVSEAFDGLSIEIAPEE